MKILIIEDVETSGLLLESLLIELGHQAKWVANTWQARVAMSRDCPELVLMDEVLPGESSLDFYPELVAQKVPFAWITSQSDRVKHDSFVESGALGRFLKPTVHSEFDAGSSALVGRASRRELAEQSRFWRQLISKLENKT